MNEFEIANRAFELFSPAERLSALTHFENLRYRNIEDRFFEAVYRVIVAQDKSVGASPTTEKKA